MKPSTHTHMFIILLKYIYLKKNIIINHNRRYYLISMVRKNDGFIDYTKVLSNLNLLETKRIKGLFLHLIYISNNIDKN